MYFISDFIPGDEPVAEDLHAPVPEDAPSNMDVDSDGKHHHYKDNLFKVNNKCLTNEW